MIKKSSIRRICVATLALFILLIIYFFPNNDTIIKEHLNYIKRDEMPIFLIDNSNYVARTSIVKSSKNINEQIKEIIETLTKNSKKSSYIRDGFKPIIPQNTKVIDVLLDNEILTINFSKELLNIDKDNEEKMIEAIIYSLTEIKEIKKIVSNGVMEIKYRNIIDSDSAYEKIERINKQNEEKEKNELLKLENEKKKLKEEKEKEKALNKANKEITRNLRKVTNSAMSSIGRQIGNAIMRGILGTKK